MKGIKIGKYIYFKSDKKGKKLMTIVNVDGKNKTIHFGSSDMEHYFDKTGLLDKKLNHKDDKRRKNYLSRSGGIKNKKGQLTKDDVGSPNFHARKILW